jgi:hypothetical protein
MPTRFHQTRRSSYLPRPGARRAGSGPHIVRHEKGAAARGLRLNIDLGAAQDRPLWGGTVPPPIERRGDIEVPTLFYFYREQLSFYPPEQLSWDG